MVFQAGTGFFAGTARSALGYLNSAAFAPRTQIRSIPQESKEEKLVGFAEHAHFFAVHYNSQNIARSSGKRSKPSATSSNPATLTKEMHLRMAVLRAASEHVWDGRAADVLAEIPVADEIQKALLVRPSHYRPVFEVVLDCESGTWEQLTHFARHIGLHEEFLPDLYLRSVGW